MSFHGPPRQCHLCGQLFSQGDPVFRTVGGVFPPEDACHGFYYVDLHWDCYVRWPQQARLAGVIFERARQQAQENPYWGVCACTDLVLITFNPDQYVNSVEVHLARTGGNYRVKPEDWSRWLQAPSAVHPFEQEALEEALRPLRETLASPEDLLRNATWPGRDKALARQRIESDLRRKRRQEYRLARQRAEQVARDGLRCPFCGETRKDHAFHDGASRRTPSYFVCAACENHIPVA